MYFIEKGFSELGVHIAMKNQMSFIFYFFCIAKRTISVFSFTLESRISSSFNHQTMTTRTKLDVISFDTEII